jgi:SAM-dependent methyltransferase
MARHQPNRKYHDRVASKYERIYGDAYWQWHDALTWEYLKPHLPRDLRAPVLDLGCGSGKWGRKFLKSGYTVTFVDLSPKMLDEARRLAAENEGLERANFLHADLMDLSALPEATFAYAVALGEPLGCASEPAQAARQIARCLVAGGLLTATVDNRVACVDHYL